MPKENLKDLLEDSKKELDQDHQNFKDTIKKDLESFKSKTLEKI